MAKSSGVLVIMMMVVVIGMMRVETTSTQENSWIICFRECSKSCADNDGDCLERCKIKCGGPNPPH
ncbi:unnamed protein product, partial [Cochlearia groenlandica]